MDLNERIKKDLAVEKEGATSSTMLECRPSEEEKLLDTIFHKKDYGFYLGLKTPISMPLYKDRNFNLELGLFDRDHNPISNSNPSFYSENSISLQMALYSSSEKPELIEFNKQGNPIIKGNDSVELVGGSATFYKISIREVIGVCNSGFEQIRERGPQYRGLCEVASTGQGRWRWLQKHQAFCDQGGQCQSQKSLRYLPSKVRFTLKFSMIVYWALFVKNFPLEPWGNLNNSHYFWNRYHKHNLLHKGEHNYPIL